MAESQKLTINVRYDIKKHFRLTESDMVCKPSSIDDAIFTSCRKLLAGFADVECPIHKKKSFSCEMGRSENRLFVEYHVIGACCDGIKDGIEKAFPYHPLMFF